MGSDRLQLSILGQEAGSQVERWVSCLIVADSFAENPICLTYKETEYHSQLGKLEFASCLLEKSNVVVADSKYWCLQMQVCKIDCLPTQIPWMHIV